MSKKIKIENPIPFIADCATIRSYLTFAFKISIPKNIRHENLLPRNTHRKEYDPIYIEMLEEFELYTIERMEERIDTNHMNFVMTYLINTRRFQSKNDKHKPYDFHYLSKKIYSNKKLARRRQLIRRILKEFYVLIKDEDKKRISRNERPCNVYPSNRVPVILYNFTLEKYLQNK